jgi:hypothetical protein
VSINTTTRLAAAAAEGRSTFVDYTINDFNQSSPMSVSDEVRAYILEEVLRPDDEWEAGIRAERIDPEKTHRILTDSFHEAKEHVQDQDVGSEVRSVFYEVIYNRWRCPFPFHFC